MSESVPGGGGSGLRWPKFGLQGYEQPLTADNNVSCEILWPIISGSRCNTSSNILAALLSQGSHVVTDEYRNYLDMEVEPFRQSIYFGYFRCYLDNFKPIDIIVCKQ